MKAKFVKDGELYKLFYDTMPEIEIVGTSGEWLYLATVVELSLQQGNVRVYGAFRRPFSFEIRVGSHVHHPFIDSELHVWNEERGEHLELHGKIGELAREIKGCCA